MRRPLVPLVVAFILGIAAASVVTFPSWAWLLGTLLMAGLALPLAASDRRRAATGLVLVLFLALGAGRLDAERRLRPADHVDRLPEELLDAPMRIEGVVTSLADPAAGDVRGSDEQDGRRRVLVGLRSLWVDGREIPVSGGARLTLVRPAVTLAYGDRIRGVFTLRRPRGYLNPGGFDYPLYLRAMGISLEGWAREGEVIERPARGEGGTVRAAAYALRERMILAVRGLLPADRASLLLAVTVGERTGLPRRIREAFLASGTYHIVAISGLHVSLLAGALFFALRMTRVPVPLSAGLSIILVTFYAALAGGNPSVVRAAVMAVVFLLALILDREADAWNSLALSALLILLWQPLFLFDAGFRLTFVATAGILSALRLAPPDRLATPWRWAMRALLASAAAFLTTAPILASTFHRISPVGVLANLVIVPVSGLLTAAGMLFALLATVIPGALGHVAAAIGVVADLAVSLAAWFGRLPFASLAAFSPTAPMVVCYYAAIGTAALRRGWRWRLCVGLVAALVLLALIWIRSTRVPPQDHLRITVLDVGQGDAIAVELPGRRAMLIDGGGLFDDRFDVGERVVVPFLLSRWIGALDLVVLSHPHPDHLNGLRAVLRQFPVRQVWDGGLRVGSPSYLWLAEVLRYRRIPHKVIEAGYRTAEFDPVEIAVLHPPARRLRGSKRGRSSDVNSNSLVLSVRYRDVRILLPGDIEREAEQVLVHGGAELAADVLKVPHHGSRTSSTGPFLARVGPAAAVISAGHRNRFRHPHPETLERFRERAIAVFRTDRDGAVTITTDGRQIDVTTMSGSRRTWSVGRRAGG
jgi:competence protein ComEC